MPACRRQGNGQYILILILGDSNHILSLTKEYILILFYVFHSFTSTNLIKNLTMKKFYITTLFLYLTIFSTAFSQQEPSQYLHEGIAAVQARAYEDAVNYLTQFLQSQPQNALGNYNRAVAYYFLQNFTEAQRDATTAITNNPSYKEAYNIRGLINTSLQIYPDAISDFTSAINLDPNYGDAFMNRGLMHKIQNDYAMAISDFNSALTVNPTLLDAYYYRGEVLVSMGNYNDAIRDLSTYIENIQDKAAAYSARGLAYYQTKQYSQAVSDLEEAIKLNPSFEKDFSAVLTAARNKANSK